MLIRVRAVEGRKPFDAPSGGTPITHAEEGVPVRATEWITRLIAQGDIVTVKKKRPVTPAETAK